MHFDSLESANLEAAYSYLEDGEYDKAEEKFKCVLDVDEKCAAA